MLHKINLPSCSDALLKVLAFERKLLMFVIDTSAIDRDELAKIFDPDVADWFWQQLNNNKRSLLSHLEALNHYLKACPSEAVSLLSAFDHDVNFHAHVSDPAYRFAYAELPETLRQLLRNIFEAGYTQLLESGFPTALHGTKDKINRKYFVDTFWKDNPNLRVCPACDGQKPDSLVKRETSDSDHFFPKSLYPFLAVHPHNLVETCTDCNRKFKGEVDPIDDKSGSPMVSCFHPYGAAGIDEIDVKVSRNGAGVARVAITDRQGAPYQRAESLNRAYKLQNRWTGRLKDAERLMLDSVLGRVRRSKPHDPILAKDIARQQVQDEIEIMREFAQTHYGTKQNAVVEAAYFGYVLSNSLELETVEDHAVS